MYKKGKYQNVLNIKTMEKMFNTNIVRHHANSKEVVLLYNNSC